jgi:hypothetical protein
MRRNFKVAPKFLENLRNPALQDPYVCFNIYAKLCYIAQPLSKETRENFDHAEHKANVNAPNIK